jgi:hypothetical protein
MNKPVKFIHIGLPKCASTFFQNIWMADPNYNRLNADGLMQFCRESANLGSFRAPHMEPLSGNLGQNPILSSEGFSWMNLNGTEEDQAKVTKLHSISAQTLASCGLSDKILIIIRNPVDWIRACHEQSIKEGGFDTSKMFLENKRQLILACLDLKHILEAYTAYFDVTVLSLDDLKNDPEQFYQWYEKELQAPAPLEMKDGDSFFQNASIADRLPLLAGMNKYRTQLLQTWHSFRDNLNEQLPKAVESGDKCLNDLTWLHRMVQDFAPDEEMNKLEKLLPTQNPDEYKFKTLDAKLMSVIQEQFLSPLHQVSTVSEERKTEYNEALLSLSSSGS